MLIGYDSRNTFCSCPWSLEKQLETIEHEWMGTTSAEKQNNSLKMPTKTQTYIISSKSSLCSSELCLHSTTSYELSEWGYKKDLHFCIIR